MRTHQTGVALVEFALVLPLLLLLSLVTAELGRAVYCYNNITKVVRDSVRYLSVQSPGTHVAEARNLILYGYVDDNGNPPLLDSSLTAANVQAPVWQTAGSDPVINTVTVRVSGYVFRPMIANLFGASFASYTFNDISATMRSPI
jgi:Flp pilus assembly protein TadG